MKKASAAAKLLQLAPAARRQELRRLAESTPRGLLETIRERGGAKLADEVADALSARTELRFRFVCASAKRGLAVEAATLLAQFEKSHHFPGLRNRLPTLLMNTEPDLAVAAQEALSTVGSESSLAVFIVQWGLFGVLANDSSVESIRVFDHAIQKLEQQAASSVVENPKVIGAMLLRDLGHGRNAEQLASKLEGADQARADASQAAAWANALRLACASEPGWSARIDLGGDPSGPGLVLAIHPGDKPDWKVDFRLDVLSPGRGSYSSWAGNSLHDDFGLPPLEHLQELPSWMRATAAVLAIRFAVTSASIEVRGAARRSSESDRDAIRSWLASGTEPGEYFERAGEVAWALAGRARCASHAGNREEAITLFRRSLALEPNPVTLGDLTRLLLQAAEATSDAASRKKLSREVLALCRSSRRESTDLFWSEACALSLLQEDRERACRTIARSLRGYGPKEREARIAQMKADPKLAWAWRNGFEPPVD